MENKKHYQINVVVPPEMKKWLDENPQINKSQLFRQAVKSKKDRIKGKVSPLFFLASTMGVLFGVVLILIGIAPSPLSKFVRASLGLIGGILSFTSAILYFKESRSLKKSILKENVE